MHLWCLVYFNVWYGTVDCYFVFSLRIHAMSLSIVSKPDDVACEKSTEQ
jgi:hypothetical protein